MELRALADIARERNMTVKAMQTICRAVPGAYIDPGPKRKKFVNIDALRASESLVERINELEAGQHDHDIRIKDLETRKRVA